MPVDTDDLRAAIPSLYPDNLNGEIDAARMREGQRLIADVIDEAIGKAYSNEAKAWAQAADGTHPDPGDLTSESAKTWAGRAAAFADNAALYDGVWFDDVAALLTDATLSYTAGPGLTVVTVGKSARTRKEGFSYAFAASSAPESYVVSNANGVKMFVQPVGRDFFGDAFGTIGNGIADDTAIINKAASAVRAAGKSYGLVFAKPVYRVSATLDFQRIRRVQMTGEFQTTISAGNAIRVGTDVSANLDMEGGDILLFVRSTQATNAAMAGSVGVELRASARCSYRLYSYGFEYGYKINAKGTSVTGYFAFNELVLGGNRNRVGLVFDQVGASNVNGWINENTFVRADLYSAGNALAGETIGVLFEGEGYGSNNNKFLTACLEGLQVPIWIQHGVYNVFQNVRMEASGSVRFGNAGSGVVYGNSVQIVYAGTDTSRAAVDWQCTRPNFVFFNWPSWSCEFSGSFEDFVTVYGQVHSTKFFNSTSGRGYFPFGVLDTAKRAFNPGSNHRMNARVRVQKGDVLRIAYGKDGASGPQFAIRALGAAYAVLPGLLSGDIPYLGTDATSNVAGLSGTTDTVGVTNAVWALPVYVSINRDEVEWLQIELLNGHLHKYIQVDKLMRSNSLSVSEADRNQVVMGISSTAVPPVRIGQLGIISATRAAIATGDGTWLQLNQFPTDFAGNILSAAAAVNTANKAAGVAVFDTTNGRLMIATGSNTTSTWKSADGAVTVTPV